MPPAERETRNKDRCPLKRRRTDGLTLVEQFHREIRQTERIFEARLNAKADEMIMRMRHEWEKVVLDCYKVVEMLKMNLFHEIATTKAEISALEEEIVVLKASIASNK